jgi:hypothetical protein
MKPIRKMRRGMSPITSTLILLGITVFAMITVIGYSNNIITHQSAQMGERLVVEKVFVESTQITIWVRNIGHGELNIVEALVNNTFHNFDPSIVLPSPDGNPTAEATQIAISGTYTPGIYQLSLFTSRANKLGIIEVEYA